MTAVQVHFDHEEHASLIFEGSWTIHDRLPDVTAILDELRSRKKIRRLSFFGDAVTGWDSCLPTFCRSVLATVPVDSVAVDLAGLPEGVVRLLDLAAKVPERAGAARKEIRTGLITAVGEGALRVWDDTRMALAFVGEVSLAFGKLLLGKAVFRMSDTIYQFRVCGAQALPIVSLISLLVGLIFAFVGAVQLKMFGAEIYVASLVAIAMVRVMGAVMAGIIISGRTGAAFAAELGTMQVNEEVDALSTFGVSPLEFLVLPRMLALIFMMPLLCVYADFMGILGGMIVGVTMLDISPAQYFHMTWQSVKLSYFVIGVLHSFVFGILIALCSCYKGINCGRSASAVGEATTAAVVTSIVSLIVATAVITFICNVMGV
ncbi:MlaE family ABC transporter permease [Oleidesulfovibrio sp.]|uniref:MlaE family ABC transporter permease n=1 Tax=Oleidesulfovibrio sp. TaxID=2909707 RepID=UPI003A849567